jgi:DUF917 family protein/N-methylhydantoinase A/oxoprolinase/acetone carboxylase beta subunit
MEQPIEAVIGIDVGGTNTDAVILQTNCQPPRVLSSAKSGTTSDVTSGIKSAITLAINNRSKGQCLAIQRINIGTTHFVNAVVQRKGLTKVVVIRLCGTASRQVPPFSDFPVDLASCINGGTYFVNGGYQVDGRDITPVEKEEILTVVSESKTKGISQFVICGIYSSFRTEQELNVRTIIKSAFPEASVTLSHEIGQVGLLERENAAILNESLKPLCRKTIAGFKKVLLGMSLTCPLFLTQNDGTVIGEQYALNHPVCTFASGPTNSMRGAAFLSGQRNAIVIDIGGTTTDVGILRNGFPREASTEIKIGGVRTNFHMPDVYSIGLGGGSYVKAEMNDGSYSVTVGPRSAGYNIKKEAFIFQDDIDCCQIDLLTATDLAVAAGHATIGNKNNVSTIPGTLVEAGIQKIKSMVELAIDNVKLSADPLPVILVGGGCIILNVQNGLEGSSELLFPSHFEVANAVGAALSQISGTVECVVNLAENVNDEMLNKLVASDCGSDISEDIDKTKKNIRKKLYEEARLEALEKTVQSAIQETVNSGADRETVTILDKSDTPLAYLPGNATRINCKAVGDIKSSNESAVFIWEDFLLVNESDQSDPIGTEDIKGTTEATESYQKVQEKPFINESHEWILSEYDIDCIEIGAGIFGCGGGGSPHLGKILAKRAIREGKIMKVVNPHRFFVNKHPTNDLVVETAYMGAPSVISEKLVNRETISSLQCMKDLYSTGHYKDGDLGFKENVEIQRENGVTFISDYKQQTSQSHTDNAKLEGNQAIRGVISAEIGGMNAMEPLLVGAELELPILDCDGMGRAFPELQMFCPLIYGVNPYPATLVDDKGRRAVVLHADTAKQLEDYFRGVVVEMGCTASLILSPLTKAQILNKTVLYSISRAWCLGNEVLLARKSKDDPVQAVLNHGGGKRLISGKITDVRRETTGGFNKGFVTITGIDSCTDQLLLVEFQNENLIARKSLATQPCVWNLVACTPDLITIVDDDTCEPVTTEMVRYGLRVSVLVLPVADIMKTPEALEVVGPQAFGYSSDVKYIPVGNYINPRIVAP